MALNLALFQKVKSFEWHFFIIFSLTQYYSNDHWYPLRVAGLMHLKAKICKVIELIVKTYRYFLLKLIADWEQRYPYRYCGMN